MKLFITILLTLWFAFGFSQKIGTVIYLEGTPSIVHDGISHKVTIGFPIYPDDYIWPGHDGLIETQWINQGKSVIMHSISVKAEDLYNSSSVSIQPSLFSSIRKVFETTSNQVRSEEGGIRRTQVELKDTTLPIWIFEDEVCFEDAIRPYLEEDYLKAAKQLHIYLQQHPKTPQSKYALFALGHCHTRLGNFVRAKEVFEIFLGLYFSDILSEDAQIILDQINYTLK